MKFIIFNLKYKMLNCNIQKTDTLDMTVGNKSLSLLVFGRITLSDQKNRNLHTL